MSSTSADAETFPPPPSPSHTISPPRTLCDMPSRRSNNGSSDEPHPRNSLRRLSSIASFQHLFARRRSQRTSTGDDVAASSRSNLSLSSSITTDPSEPPIEEDWLTELPAPPAAHAHSDQPTTRRSSYVCLPDDPIGGMPRSRTFSNLPLPTRAKKTPTMTGPLTSHSRLPSAIFPSTRLPSPQSSTRKHSHTRLTSTENKSQYPIRNRVKRSDTEPLLGLSSTQHTSNLPRSTAFKENISLSPIKPLPALDMSHNGKYQYSSSPPLASQYHPPGAWVSSSSELGDIVSSTTSYTPPPYPPVSKYDSHPAIQMVREHKSSPARPLYRSSRDRPPNPGASTLDPVAQTAPAQRWNSQPVLTNRSVNRGGLTRTDSKYQLEIKPTRLMSARQASTPQPPKTPLGDQFIAVGSKAKGANDSGSKGHNRQASERTPSQKKSSIQPGLSAQHVTRYEQPAYWAGRLSTLADRYRNEDLASFMNPDTAPPTSTTGNSATSSAGSSSSKGPLSTSSQSSMDIDTTLTPKSQTDKMHTPEASTARLKKALEHLASLCATPEAKESLVAFQTQFAATMKLPELRPPKQILHLGDSSRASNADGEEKSGRSISENRKASFMDRLLGRGGQGKRRSLVLG